MPEQGTEASSLVLPLQGNAPRSFANTAKRCRQLGLSTPTTETGTNERTHYPTYENPTLAFYCQQGLWIKTTQPTQGPTRTT